MFQSNRIKDCVRYAAFVVILGAASWPLAASGSPFAYIPNAGDNTVSVIDCAINDVIATIPVGPGPRAVALSPHGDFVYVVGAYDSGIPGPGEPTGRELSVIDAAGGRVVHRVPFDRPAGGVAISPDGKQVYVTQSMGADTGFVLIIDTATYSILETQPVDGAYPEGIAVRSDGTVWVANYLHVGEQRPCWAEVLYCATPVDGFQPADPEPRRRQLIIVGDELEGLAISPDGKFGYVTNIVPAEFPVTKGALAVLDLQIPHVVTQISLTPGYSDSPYGIAVTPDGTRAYVTHLGGVVSVVDLVNRNLLRKIAVGTRPEGVSITPDGRRAYVANNQSDTVSVIDTATDTVIDTIAVGKAPVAFGQFIGPVGPSIPSPTVTVDPCTNTCDGRACSIGGVSGDCLPTEAGCACVLEVTPTQTRTGDVTPTPTDTLNDCCAHHTCPELCNGTPTPVTTPLTPAPCFGDCDGNGQVTISDLISMVIAALGIADNSGCMIGSEPITIADLVRAVNEALGGCGK